MKQITKTCRICKETKNIEDFSKSDYMADGHRNECKKCANKIYVYKEKIRERNLEKEIKTEGNKICRICSENKSLDQFHVKRGTSDGHRSECKECVKDVQKKYKEEPGFKEKQKEYDKKRYEEKREEILERKKEYHKENRETILKKKSEYRDKLENKERIKKYLDTYREENREELREYIRNNPKINSKHQANYRKRYPHIIAWRSLLYSTLKRLGTPKESHTIDMLGYSALDLKHHIEKLFTTGMSWNNHGEWHIDHIKEVITFDENSDIKEVCALKNLRPLWATTREIDGIIYEGNLNRSRI